MHRPGRVQRTAYTAATIALLASACIGFPEPLAEDGGTSVDSNTGSTAPPDAAGLPDAEPSDAGCEAPLPFAPSNVSACDLTERNPPISLTEPLDEDPTRAYRLNTDTGLLTGLDVGTTLSGAVIAQEGAPEILAIVTESFELAPGASLGVTGSRALVLLSTGDIAIGGRFSVGATADQSGPGGNHGEACATGRGKDAPEPEPGPIRFGGSGGGGGGFGDVGGTGAPGFGLSNPPATEAGQASGAAELIPLRGGCAGGKGGFVQGGAGGGGGGALQLVAGGTLTIQSGAVVTARGGGGAGIGPISPLGDGCGGGGGGSGGAILLEATTLHVNGFVTANGGGGGEGSGRAGDSADGANGRDTQDVAAPGGAGVSRGGDGGQGGAGATARGGNGLRASLNPDDAGGGGGGGSAGRIHLRAIAESPDLAGGLLSPAPQ